MRDALNRGDDALKLSESVLLELMLSLNRGRKKIDFSSPGETIYSLMVKMFVGYRFMFQHR